MKIENRIIGDLPKQHSFINNNIDEEYIYKLLKH
jgi:hypothetical protein